MGTGISTAGLSAEELLSVIGEYFEARRMSVRDAFNFLDVDSSGYITWDEFLRGVQLCTEGTGHQSLPHSNLMGVFRRFDVNGDGKLNIDEFAKAFSPSTRFGSTYYDSSFYSRGRGHSMNSPSIRSNNRYGMVAEQQAADEITARIAGAIVRTGNSPMDLFTKLDKDRNGRLSRAELGEVIVRFQPDLSVSEREAVFNRFDRDRSGGVDLNEFCRVLQEQNGVALVAVEEKVELLQRKMRAQGLTLYDAYSVFDRDGNGFLSREEWHRAMGVHAPGLSPQDLDAVFRRFDLNGDGYLGINEFQNFFQDSIDRRVTSVGHTHGSMPTYSAPPIEAPWETEILDLVRSCLSPARTGMTTSEIFRRLDIDNSGGMAQFEFNRMITTYRPALSPQQLDQLFYKVNVSRTGIISLSEFVRRFG